MASMVLSKQGRFLAVELRPPVPFNAPSPERFCSSINSITRTFSCDLWLDDGEIKVGVAANGHNAIGELYAHAYEGLGIAQAPTVPGSIVKASRTDFAAGAFITPTSHFATLPSYNAREDMLTAILIRLRSLNATIWIQTLVEPIKGPSINLKGKLYLHSLRLKMEGFRVRDETPSRAFQAIANGAEQKMLRRLFRVSLRAVAFSSSRRDAEEAIRSIGSVFEAIRGPEGPMTWQWEDPQTIIEHMVKRKHVRPFFLASPELCSLIRLPSPLSITGMNVKRFGLRLQPARPALESPFISLGTYIADEKSFRLPLSDFLAHTLLLGATGFGKSTLLVNLIHALQAAGSYQRKNLPTNLLDAADFQGIGSKLENPSEAFVVIVIDLEGELGHRLLRTSRHLPMSYYHLYEAPFTYNPLEVSDYADAEERDTKVTLQAGNIAASIGETTGLSERWSPRMLAVLRKCLTALMRSKDAATLSELRQLLYALPDERRLNDLISRLGLDEDLRAGLREYSAMWQRISETIFGLQYRLDVFLDSLLMRRTFSSPRSTLDFKKMLLPGTVSILNLGGLDIPLNFRQALASMLVWRVWLAILDRSKVVEEARRWPVIVVADEFQLMASLPLLSQILAEMRKNAMFLYFANQNLPQLHDPLISSLLTNTGLQFFFNLNGEDARRVAQNMDPTLADEIVQTLVGLTKFQAMIRVKGEREYVAPYLIRCDPPAEDARTEQQIQEALKVIKAERLRMIGETVQAEKPPWTSLVSLPPPPPPSLFRIILAVWELQAQKGPPTLTGLSESSLAYVPKNKYSLSNLIESALNGGYIKHVPVLGRDAYQVTEKAEAILFPGVDATSTARAGLDKHRSLILESQWNQARSGCFPIRIDETSPSSLPDAIIIPPHPFQDSWDYERASALEAETYPEKHPDRVRWHIVNDLRNLCFHRVIFAVENEEKKVAIEDAITQLDTSLKSRVEIRIIKQGAG